MSKIECRIKRPSGSVVEMPNGDSAPAKYHFKPIDASRADSPHVADVKNVTHYERFLRLDPRVYVPFNPDGVVPVGAPLAMPVAPTSVVPPPYREPALIGSDAFPADIELVGGKALRIDDVVAEAHKASGLTVEQWNDLAAPVRVEKIQAAIQTIAAEGGDAVAQLAASSMSAANYGTTVSSQVSDSTGSPPAPDDDDAAGEGVLSVRQLKAGIADGTLTQEALREIMAKEEGAEAPRQSFIAVIVKALK